MPHFERKHPEAVHISKLKLGAGAVKQIEIREEFLRNPETVIEWKTFLGIYNGVIPNALNGLNTYLKQDIRFTILNVPQKIYEKMLAQTLKARKKPKEPIPFHILALHESREMRAPAKRPRIDPRMERANQLRRHEESVRRMVRSKLEQRFIVNFKKSDAFVGLTEIERANKLVEFAESGVDIPNAEVSHFLLSVERELDREKFKNLDLRLFGATQIMDKILKGPKL